MTIYDAKKVHFVGIGGIGVSALAQWFLSRGCRVTGSNLSNEPVLRILRRKGAKVYVGRHSKSHVRPDAKLVIYSTAVNRINPERKKARRLGITEMSYPEAVGELTEEKFTIAICGAHGKSTTTALAALTFVRAGFDPTVIVGTKLREFSGTNFRYGNSPFLVLEADEWKGAFWNYHPDIVILTTMDREHLDFYKDTSGVERGFRKFLRNLPEKGIVIANGNDPWVKRVAKLVPRSHYFYALRDGSSRKIRRVIKVPGEHNVSNALAVLKLAEILGLPQNLALSVIGNYRGAWRRFEYRGKLNGARLFDDYAHHPTEIKATLEGARGITTGKLWCVFQPHQYQRLKTLFKEFTTAFDAADRVILLPAYAVAGRERPAAFSVNSKKLAVALRKRGVNCNFVRYFKDAADILRKELDRTDICLLMGAGDIVKIHKFLHNR